MKRCTTSNVIRKMQITAIMRNHYIPIRLAKIWDTDNRKSWKECAAAGTFKHRCWEYKVQPFWKIPCQFLIKLNILLSHTTQKLCSSVFTQRNLNSSPYKNLYLDVYSIFTYNCPNLETTNMLPSGEQINKLWYIQTVKYYSVP